MLSDRPPGPRSFPGQLGRGFGRNFQSSPLCADKDTLAFRVGGVNSRFCCWMSFDSVYFSQCDGAGSPGVPMRQADVLFLGPWRRGVLRRTTPGAMVRTRASDARALEMALFLIHGLSAHLLFSWLGKRRRTSRRVSLPSATTTVYVVPAARGQLFTRGGCSQGNCNNL